ncbi:DISARM system helicase DrmA [Paenibacillus sp. Soil787]|uniref:DISARM system helicase DrmA n=1 Tax=Paenibacillus sp. Soil787 TaxID=1736411 RepID=UPI0006F52F4C|nr:DISARM system helicase DrmA [Paenibacillus sp. Soil787]KRF39823.1 hypothetical protein ASG93_22940 [Paenibacillus sp. Soil787]
MKLTPISKKIQEILILNPEGLTIETLTQTVQNVNSHIKTEQVERTLETYSELFIKSVSRWRIRSIAENEMYSAEVMNIIDSNNKEIDPLEKTKEISSHEYEMVRNELEKRLLHNLIGPVEEKEILLERPNVYYLGGMLYPANSELQIVDDNFEMESETKEDDRTDDEKGFEEEPQVNRYYPSSIGLTCNLTSELESLMVTCKYGIYVETKDENGKKAYVREPKILCQEIIIAEQKGEFIENKAQCKWFVRNNKNGNALTIFFVNRFPASHDVPIEQIFYQPEITVESNNNLVKYPFVKRNIELLNILDDSDVDSNNLLYRDVAEFAVGHGCAVDWRESDYNHGKACRIKTTLTPSYEVPAVQHLELPDLIGLDMKVLAYIKRQERLKEILTPLVENYNSWIKKNKSIKLEKYNEQQQKHMEICQEASDRIMDGIEILSSDAEVFEAFKFANEIMLYQRSYSQWAARYRNTKIRDAEPVLQGKWRPFQLAFILLNVKSFYNPADKERNLAELLWFPTGGGKTEAYLGLAAFVMALRRIRGNKQGISAYAGTTVLMRYTLRLLTIQQFQRASSLICAAEFLRSRNPIKWGEEKFSIGLWVGGGTTPNTFMEAKEVLADLKRGKRVFDGNPVQLHHCPWCGEELSAQNYFADKEVFKIICPNLNCHFSTNIIPAYTVDEAIYYQCPSILIGTVDKFARLPWNGDIASMFGHVDRYCQRHGFIRKGDDHEDSHLAANGFLKSMTFEIQQLLPPELIIQDELHLISGPLGSMVGLYETVVDFLSTWNGVRPKVVASTATIRRSDEQMKGVFNRTVKQFPPSGINSDDSFFSYAVSKDEIPGRKYVGLFLPGASGKTSLVRIYAALLQAVYELKSKFSDEHLDPYWTLVGYFNSLRELGGTVRLIEDDIDDRIRYLKDKISGRRYINNTEELTSRIPATDIPKILSKLEQTLASGKSPVDVLLATNMISVGVDIDRLGLMAVTGQPKGTSEYIQATSRVGRKYPGLVFVLYNWSRPRDISHYEQFISYHSKLYSYVEATSVTPYSYRARDKALAAIVIGMLRQIDDSLFRNSYAKNFNDQNQYIQRIKATIIDRCKQVELVDNKNIEEEIDDILGWWMKKSEEHASLLDYAQYKFSKKDTPVLLRGINQDIPGARLVPDSLRDVEAEVKVYYLDLEEEAN